MLCEIDHRKSVPPRDEIPATVGPVRSLVTRDRVYIRVEGRREELYDRLNDPMERVDLARFPQSRSELAWFREQLDRLRGGLTVPTR